MTKKECHSWIPLSSPSSVTPEWFYQGSTVF